MRVAASEGPPLGLVAPFFVVAPLGLLAAGALFMASGEDALLAINAPRTVAVTHATVLGWLTLSIMGAIYQLGPAVLGGRLRWPRLARIQFWLHATSVAGFVVTLSEWNVPWMGLAGSGLVVSFILFLVNAIPAVRWFRRGSMPRLYISTAMLFLVAAASLGITWVGTLEHLWFPVTLGRLSGHAHLGLVGWLAIMVMGVSYQLVPMFNVVQDRQPRFDRPALAITAVAAATAGVWLMSDPGPGVRATLAAGLVAGPAIWAIDMVRLLRARARRNLDIQGRATFVSLTFLAAAMVLGVLSAIGEPVAPGGEPARLQLAYGVVAAGGWAGCTLIGNSYKILPFLVWYHRYRQLAGTRPIPVVADLYSERWALATLLTHAAAVAVLAVAALLGSLAVLHLGGGLLAASGGLHFSTLATIVLRRDVPARPPASLQGVLSR